VRRSIFLAPFRQYVKEAKDSHELFIAPAERAVGVKDLTFRVLVEDTVSRRAYTSQGPIFFSRKL
jgi:hypothetical protein